MADSYNMSVTMVLASALASKDHPAVQGMQVQLTPYQVRNDVPMFGLHGVVSRPMPGAQIVTLFQGGENGNAVGIAVNDPRYFLTGLPDGTVGIAHHLGAHILFYADHVEINGGGMPVKITNASMTRIEGEFQTTGDVTARCDDDPRSLYTHKHKDSLGGTTTPPIKI